jgi:hypothetical protein
MWGTRDLEIKKHGPCSKLSNQSSQIRKLQRRLKPQEELKVDERCSLDSTWHCFVSELGREENEDVVEAHRTGRGTVKE